MFGTDKQDIFNFKMPGGADAIVGIGEHKAVQFGGKQDKQLARLRTDSVPKYKPPKQKDEVTVESARKSQKDNKKRKGFKYLSKEDETDINTILGSMDNISPGRIGATGSLAATLGIIGSPDED
jgi:hypothetical protein